MLTTSVTIALPDVPAVLPPNASNVFQYYRWYIRGLLNPTASEGFRTRLWVLFALAGYGLVIAFLFLGAQAVEYRRRKKQYWLWRLVDRPSGRYIVANQHAIFALCSIVSCCILIGYLNNARRVVLLLRYQQRAFFWRTFVWVPLILHAWLSSWANLQAAILSGQKATNKHLLSPLVANTLYIAGIVVLLLPIIVLDAYSGFTWRRAWDKALILKALLIAQSDSFPTATDDEARAILMPALDALNSQLQFFGTTQRAAFALYVVACFVLLFVNFGGLGLLFVLRKQIRFNTRRLSTHVRTGTLPNHTSISPSNHTGPFSPSPEYPMSPELAMSPQLAMLPSSPHPLSPQLDARFPPKALLRKVLFASQTGKGTPQIQLNDDKMTVSQLKEAASDKTPAGAASREQAKQLLALKKIEADVFIFLTGIVVLCVVFLALALWLAIQPAQVYSSWAAIETAFFLIPWLYLVGVCACLTFLFINACTHLLSNKPRNTRGRRTSVVGLGGGRFGGRGSVSGLTSDDFQDSFSRPQVAVVVERHVTVEMDDSPGRDESPGGSRR